jgi:hypothetical protein
MVFFIMKLYFFQQQAILLKTYSGIVSYRLISYMGLVYLRTEIDLINMIILTTQIY